MQKYFCKTLTCCLLCNHINHFDLHASCVRLRYASSAVHWPFRQQTWGCFHSFLLLRNLSYRQRRENVNLQARTGLRTDLSRAPADQAAVPLSFVSCSKEHRAWKCSPGPARNKIMPGWLNSWMTFAAGVRYHNQRLVRLLLNSQQNTICSAK